MPTSVDILTFVSVINTTSERLKARNFFFCLYFSSYEQLKLSTEKSFITSRSDATVNADDFGRVLFLHFHVSVNFAIFVQIFVKFSPKCRTKKLGMQYTILSSFFICKVPIFGPKSCLGKSLSSKGCFHPFRLVYA